jgi:hypothetical protein
MEHNFAEKEDGQVINLNKPTGYHQQPAKFIRQICHESVQDRTNEL